MERSSESEDLARVLRKLGELLQNSGSLDWAESRERNRDILNAIISGSSRSRDLARLIEGAEYKRGGDEHNLVRVDSRPDRVFKVTHSDSFGCRAEFFLADIEDVETHFFLTTNYNPLFYLQRWLLLNSFSPFQTRYEGLIPAEHAGHLPRICISQPVLERHSLSHPNPTDAEIENGFKHCGFEKIGAGTFLNSTTRILLTDAQPKNVRIHHQAGQPPLVLPFDVIAEIASEAVLQWAESP